MEESRVWQPEFGEVIVYTLGKCPSRMFMFNHECRAGFYYSIPGSSEEALKGIGTGGGKYHKNICRKATAPEIEEYIINVSKSKYFTENLKRILSERNYK